MKRSTQKATWTSAGCAITLLTGLAALADDTELLLINPDPTLQPKPNVMFILHTSGSMLTKEMSVEQYDSTVNYAGSCDTTKGYWTTGGADGNDVRLGGAARLLPHPARRNLYTNNGDTSLSAASNQISIHSRPPMAYPIAVTAAARPTIPMATPPHPEMPVDDVDRSIVERMN